MPQSQKKHGFQVMAGSLAAASFVAVTQILTLGSLDKCLLIGVWLFAATLPGLVRVYMKAPLLGEVKDFKDKPQEEQNAFMAFFNLVLFNVIGFTFVFFHFGLIAGALFSVAAAWALWVWMDKPEVTKLIGFVLLFPRYLVGRGFAAMRRLIAKLRQGSSRA